MEYDKEIQQTTEKVYGVTSTRKRNNGEIYEYKNYETFVPYEYLESVGITGTYAYMYIYENSYYMTSTEPDGTVPYKKLRLNISNTMKTQLDWKRFFVIPKRFFPYVNEAYQTVFTLDPTQTDKFSNSKCTLKMELKEI